MNHLKKSWLPLMIVLLSLPFIMAPGSSSTQNCTIPAHDNVADGSSHYSSLMCNQTLVDHWWGVFDMRESDWDSGFGYYDACNMDLPLARTFAAMYLLTYSAQDYATNTGDYSGNALRWGYPYTANNAGRTSALCFKPGSTPGQWAAWAYGSRMELYIPYFYNMDVAARAATLLHEARHTVGKAIMAEAAVQGELPAIPTGRMKELTCTKCCTSGGSASMAHAPRPLFATWD